MSRTRRPPTPRIAFLRAGAAVLPAGVWLLASACGPGAATPMPEPPAFDLNRVNNPELESAKTPLDPNVHMILGGPGAVPAGAVVRATNLEQTLPVEAVNATAQGAFELAVTVANGEQLRLEWADGKQHSAPADVVFVLPDPAVEAFTLQPVQRVDCLKLSPGPVLDFADDAQASLTLRNTCQEALFVSNPRTRLGLPELTLPDNLPLTIRAGETASMNVGFTRAAPGLLEDVLFFDVQWDTAVIRYAVTLRDDQ